MAKKEQPEFYGGAPTGAGQKVPHEAGRAARLAAEGIPPAQTLEEYQAARNAAAGDQLVIEPPTLKSIVGHQKDKAPAAPAKKSPKKEK